MGGNVKTTNSHIRNIAIIAHVDHGKTTLVDAMFSQSGVFRTGEVVEERVMDNMDLERERGITIAAKNCSVVWKGVRINILDTPGHADFGGEVERALSMVDGALLLVDASEGPLPQTRFVLSKALALGLKLILVINKIDRSDARPAQVLSEVYDLLIDLDAREDQLEFPLLYANGKAGVALKGLGDSGRDLSPLFETILEQIPGPSYLPGAPFQMMVSDLSYSDYLGRLAIGKVQNGAVRAKDRLCCLGEGSRERELSVGRLQCYEGPALKDVEEAGPGEIVVLSGIDEVHIGDTICSREALLGGKALPPLHRLMVDEPTVSMRFSANTSPLNGQEGRFVQFSKLRERLAKECRKNVSLRMEDLETGEGCLVKGRGEFQMVILIETLRREGYEMTVGRPEVIFRREGGGITEPVEHLYIDCAEAYQGAVTEKLSRRRGIMLSYLSHSAGRVRLEFSIPSRGLIGYRDEFLTDTKGTGLINSYLSGYEAYRGDFPQRANGSLVADRSGEAVPYALFNLEPRGRLFILPGMPVYEGMIIGEHNRGIDLNVNPCKTKKLSNMRAAGKDEAVTLTPVLPMTLEAAIQFIREGEQVEVTPRSIRLRKALLTAQDRKTAQR
ncbi:MAG: translational GTPase TypA [Spirochaetales bacterium]|jgi:GTP-binding protein|nr:translational GTPase TypA [Spirochaetales bacterium]